MADPWWTEQCPARQAGLKHAHWDRCDPSATHPGSEPPVTHDASQCCECGLMVNTHPPAAAERPRTYGRPATQDHAFRFTIGGCAICRKPEDVHPIFIPQPAEGECVVDHRSIEPAHLINDGGLEWRRCPICHDMIEPALATGHPNGPKTGAGRLPVTERMRRRWESLKFAHEAGYYES